MPRPRTPQLTGRRSPGKGHSPFLAVGTSDYTSTPGGTAAPWLALAGMALAGVAGLAYRRQHRSTSSAK
ncbi:MAG TPA: LPXTG cell wall anchor domain-containing protein [Ardenticatenaceae bacterium]